jgi:hypothetical protein
MPLIVMNQSNHHPVLECGGQRSAMPPGNVAADQQRCLGHRRPGRWRGFVNVFRFRVSRQRFFMALAVGKRRPLSHGPLRIAFGTLIPTFADETCTALFLL